MRRRSFLKLAISVVAIPSSLTIVPTTPISKVPSRIFSSSATLRKEDWIKLDEAVLGAARRNLRTYTGNERITVVTEFRPSTQRRGIVFHGGDE